MRNPRKRTAALLLGRVSLCLAVDELVEREGWWCVGVGGCDGWEWWEGEMGITTACFVLFVFVAERVERGDGAEVQVERAAQLGWIAENQSSGPGRSSQDSPHEDGWQRRRHVERVW